MDIELKNFFKKFEVPRENLKVSYDKTGKKRPAWIQIDGLTEKVWMISLRINGKLTKYMAYLNPEIPLFIPVNYTPEEMKKYYNKFSEVYDKFVINNVPATKFLLKKFNLPKDAKILDLGAGTGLVSEAIIQSGYYSITLVDFSKGMLEKAKKKKALKGCKFIQKDIKTLNLREKFDLIISIFSFASNSYFNEEDLPTLWKVAHNHLKPNGILAILGHDYEPPDTLFKKIETGTFKMLDSSYVARWYVGKKK